MDRGSDKHGPRLDEEMAREARPLQQGNPTEARAEEERQVEPPADGEPQPDARLRAASGTDDLEARSELARFLEPSVFPAGRDDLVEAARRQGAPAPLIDRLSRLPDDTVFENVQTVWEEARLR